MTHFCVEWDAIPRLNSVVQRREVIGHVSDDAAQWVTLYFRLNQDKLTHCLSWVSLATHVVSKLVIMLRTTAAVLDPIVSSIQVVLSEL